MSSMSSEYKQRLIASIDKMIPADVFMISGSADSQTSADAWNVGKFQLPNPNGKAGGACTSAVLETLYTDNKAATHMSWVEMLTKMRLKLKNMNYNQIPQLTSSKLIDVNQTMYIVPPDKIEGKKRCVLIGINYTGQRGELRGCHNDVKNVKDFLINVHAFPEEEMLILMDDGHSNPPTRNNITKAFQRLTEYSQPGDVCFIHYSGHGGRAVDLDGDEADGYDETLIPVDFEQSGQIIDDDILKILVKPMRRNVNVTVLMDCCHSGTVLDLPYRFSAIDTQMKLDSEFSHSIPYDPADDCDCDCCNIL